MGKNITIYNIAQEAGVSTATVSRVLSGSTLVNKMTAQRVLDVMEKHDYHPSTIARSLYKQTSRTLCILLPELGNPYYSSLFSSVIRGAEEEGFTLQTLYQPYGSAITESMAQRLIEQRVDGVVMNGESLSVQDEAQMALLRRMGDYMRVVLLGGMPPVPRFPTITINLAACVERAVGYLHGALGHQSIWLVGGKQAPGNPYSRTAGYAVAMQRCGLSECFLPCECTCDDAYDLMRAQSALPTAIICANDMVALGVMRAAFDRGLRIPQDLSVIGCDNTYLGAYLPTRLTTFDIGDQKTGELAMSMAAGLCETRNVLISGELVVRDSCAHAPKGASSSNIYR